MERDELHDQHGRAREFHTLAVRRLHHVHAHVRRHPTPAPPPEPVRAHPTHVHLLPPRRGGGRLLRHLLSRFLFHGHLQTRTLRLAPLRSHASVQQLRHGRHRPRHPYEPQLRGPVSDIPSPILHPPQPPLPVPRLRFEHELSVFYDVRAERQRRVPEPQPKPGQQLGQAVPPLGRGAGLLTI